MVGARLHCDVTERAEEAATSTQLETQGVAHEQRGGVVAGLGWVGPRKGGGLDRAEFEVGDENDGVFVRAAQRAQAQEVDAVALRGVGLHHPFAPTGANEVAGLEVCGSCGHGLGVPGPKA